MIDERADPVGAVVTARSAPMPETLEAVATVRLAGGAALAVRRREGPLRPFLLVHGLGADGTSWDAVARRLGAAGHPVVAVDLRGHGRSDDPGTGHDTDTAADDLAELSDRLGLTGARTPVVAGHGWGANVAMSLAARRGGVAALACVDGGWLRPSWRHPRFDDYWRSRGGDDATGTDPAATRRRLGVERSLHAGEPRAWYPLVRVPVTLCPVVPPDGRPDPAGRGAQARTGVAEALAGLPDARVSWLYAEGDGLAADPARLVDELLALAAATEPAAG